jgi:hypothetical protein
MEIISYLLYCKIENIIRNNGFLHITNGLNYHADKSKSVYWNIEGKWLLHDKTGYYADSRLVNAIK